MLASTSKNETLITEPQGQKQVQGFDKGVRVMESGIWSQGYGVRVMESGIWSQGYGVRLKL